MTASAIGVGVVGYGAVGSTVGRALAAGDVDGLELRAVLDPRTAPPDYACDSLDEVIERCEIVVEAANPTVLTTTVRPVLSAGRSLVALSLGAFLSEDLWPLVVEPTPAPLYLSTGAIGGLDLIRAARLADDGIRVTLTSRKKPRALEQPWMTATEIDHLRSLSDAEEWEVFSGDPRQAAARFPQNLNVAAALAIALRDRTAVDVRLVADAATTRTVHEIAVTSRLGEHTFRIGNLPSPRNPASSELVVYSVLRTLGDLAPSPAATFR